MAGSAVLTVGALSLCAHFASSLFRERILLWFGLFAAPYGIALLCHSVLLAVLDGKAEIITPAAGRLFAFVASIPILFLFREFYGKGWRRSDKWLVWAYIASSVGAFLLSTLHERTWAIPSPGMTLVILVPLKLLVDRIAGYRPPSAERQPIVLAGLSFFFLTFAYDRVKHLWLGGFRVTAEPLGFLVLMLCLGFVVWREVAHNEAEWLSMSHEMMAAGRIQAAILPVSMPKVSGLSLAARYSPVSAVAGDFYSFPRIDSDGIGIVVADVMGHGVPGALVASMVKVSVFSGARRNDSPGKIIETLNAMLCQEAPNQLATAAYLDVDRRRGVGTYSAAGNPPPLIWRRSTQTLEVLEVPGLLLGVRPAEEFQNTLFRFATGDRLLIYTDGLTEAENKAEVSFGSERLPALFAENQASSTEQFATRLLHEVLYWPAKATGAYQEDDITFVVIDFS